MYGSTTVHILRYVFHRFLDLPKLCFYFYFLLVILKYYQYVLFANVRLPVVLNTFYLLFIYPTVDCFFSRIP